MNGLNGGCEPSGDWSGPDRTTLFHQLFEQNASDFPDKVALRANGRTATYGELAGMAHIFAHALQEAGARLGDRIALCADVSAESVAAALGVLSTGCVLVPINQLSGLPLLLEQLEDCGAVVLIANIRLNLQAISANTKIREVIPIGFGGTALDGRFNARDSTSTAIWHRSGIEGLNEKCMAAIFYSSGSTARPKGVLMSHANMVAAFTSVTSYLKNTADDVVLSFTAGLSSDYGFYNTLMPLLFGGTAIVHSSLPSTTRAIRTMVQKDGVTGLQVFPPAILRFVEECDSDLEDIPSLRYISSSGGVLPKKHIARLRSVLPSVDIFSNYGMTECKRIAFLPPDEIDRRSDSVGKAIPSVQTYLIDESGDPFSAPNTTGELAVTGDLLMQGYWNQPELTSQVLKENYRGHTRIFFTGDLFRLDEDGFLYFVCRKNDLFYRDLLPVNHVEVEKYILEHEAVSEVAVVPVPGTAQGYLPKACIVLKRGSSISEEELLRYCEGGLNPHCVPTQVTFLESLPRTFGGKASRAGLCGTTSRAR